MRYIDHAAPPKPPKPASRGAASVGAAVGRQAPPPKQPHPPKKPPGAAAEAALKTAFPNLVGPKAKQQAISQHISHYAENPRAHSQALRKLGYSAAQLRVIHRNQTRPDPLQTRLQSLQARTDANIGSGNQAMRHKSGLGPLGDLNDVAGMVLGAKPSDMPHNILRNVERLVPGTQQYDVAQHGPKYPVGAAVGEHSQPLTTPDSVSVIPWGPFGKGLRAVKADAKIAQAATRDIPAAHVPPYVGKYDGVGSVPSNAHERGYSYHYTTPDHLKQIQREGLKATKPAGNPKGVYFGNEPIVARGLSQKRTASVYLRVHNSKLKEVEQRAFGETRVSHDIPAAHLEYLGKDGKWYPLAKGAAGTKRLYTQEGPLTREEAQYAAGKQVRDALPSARKAATEQKQVYKAARGEKFAQAKTAGEAAGGGTAGYKAELGQLKGQLPKVKFERLMKGNLNQADLESLFKNLENHPDLKYGETLTGRAALIKAFQEGHALAPHEIKVLSKAFGEDVGKMLAHKSFPRRVGENALGVLNLPRALMASIDASFPGRQGLGVLAAAPHVWAKGFKPQFRGMFSEAYYHKMLGQIHADPAFEQATQGGVKFTELGKGGAHREEPFVSSLLTERPAKYNPIRASARAYSMYGDYVRLELFKKYLAKAERQGVDVTNKKELRGIGKVVNTLSGRGGGRRLQQASPVISPLVFAPQLIASRLNMLNPIWYTRLGGVESAFARRQARIAGARLGVGAAAVLGGAAAAGAKVQTDPRSSDFAKVRLGNTRLDILGGLQQYPRAAAQIASGKSISSTTGRTMTLGPGFGQMSRKDILERFAQSKLSPPASVAADWLQGKTFQGQPLNAKQEALSHLTPLALQDAAALANGKGGSLPKAVGGYALSALGVGVQTYGASSPHQQKLQKFVKNELPQAIKATRGAKMTPLLQGRLALRMERVKAREAVDFRDPVKRLSADIDVIRRHKWISARQATEWKQHLRAPGLTSRDYGDVSRYLTNHFFDQGNELSASMRYLQENGNPKLRLPAIP